MGLAVPLTLGEEVGIPVSVPIQGQTVPPGLVPAHCLLIVVKYTQHKLPTVLVFTE